MKGEVLAVNLEKAPEAIYNRGVYIVPNGELTYNVGATYGQPPFVEGVTHEGRVELEEKLKALIALPYRVVDQRWGIRPTSPDRRPILGSHPAYKNVFIFNGLGTKGVSLAPYFSYLLATHLTDGDEIMKEVNIQRFYPLYSGSR
jgi:glycine/D-amino acid oxidase-like deaminating enzyme